MTNFSEQLQHDDPEFARLFDRFAFEETAGPCNLDGKTRHLAILAALIGCQGIEEYRAALPMALERDVTPVEAKEVVYQATAYLGIGRVYPFLTATNEILRSKGISLPLPPQRTTTPENRRERGTAVQVEIFGPHMEDFWKAGDMNRFLAANCFGDYYTRTGLNLKQRELVTFCYIAAQGGCESQLSSHAAANLRMGNDRDFLARVVLQLAPYLGYPRSLNAMAAVNQAAGQQAK